MSLPMNNSIIIDKGTVFKHVYTGMIIDNQGNVEEHLYLDFKLEDDFEITFDDFKKAIQKISDDKMEFENDDKLLEYVVFRCTCDKGLLKYKNATASE